jgi:hypothetical protein
MSTYGNTASGVFFTTAISGVNPSGDYYYIECNFVDPDYQNLSTWKSNAGGYGYPLWTKKRERTCTLQILSLGTDWSTIHAWLKAQQYSTAVPVYLWIKDPANNYETWSAPGSETPTNYLKCRIPSYRASYNAGEIPTWRAKVMEASA